MEHAKHPPLAIVLRRFKNEVVELLPANTQMSADEASASAVLRIRTGTDGDHVVYHVLLPDTLTVQPVDWRRFAYDHSKVAELLSVCVRDNVLPMIFEPRSDDLREVAETTLTVALGDLSSVFDVLSVRCESPEPPGLLVTIEGEHKSGERRSYVVRVELGSA